jgi:8-oxo-dGTP diphosphatase
LEFGETLENCAKRGVLEEAGIKIESVSQVAYTNDFFPEANKHYVTLFVMAAHISGEAQECEPEKCGHWHWVNWKDLPKPHFSPIEHLLEQGFEFSAHLCPNPPEYASVNA